MADGKSSQGAVCSPDNRTLLMRNMMQREIQVLAIDAQGHETGQRIALKAGPASIRSAVQ